MTNPVPDVLADLLSKAAETGRLMETLQLLEDLAGPAMVKAAVGICIDRRRAAMEGRAGVAGPPPPEDVFSLTSRLRATKPGGRP